MENKKEKVALNDEVLDKVAGGGQIDMIFGPPTCNCTGEAVEMTEIGPVSPCSTIILYQCPNCGATTTTY